MLAAVLLIALIGALAYYRAPILAWTVVLAVWLAGLQLVFGCPVSTVAWGIFAVIAAVLNIVPLRRAVFTGPVFGVFKKITPAMSQTEQEAINAGTVWWDRDLFSGKPD
ncbi:MAG: acyl-CoA dehydrogenase, partial [Aquitalea sp.]|nr:acyl-CoA dehydrogenase [Aquitalea sp.]